MVSRRHCLSGHVCGVVVRWAALFLAVSWFAGAVFGETVTDANCPHEREGRLQATHGMVADYLYKWEDMNLWQMFFTGAAHTITTANYTWDEYIECGSRPDEESCNQPLPSIVRGCKWSPNLGYPDKFGTGSCVTAYTADDPLTMIGVQLFYTELDNLPDADPNHWPEMSVFFECMKYSRGSAEECNSRVVNGHHCHACAVPVGWYPFQNPPMWAHYNPNDGDAESSRRRLQSTEPELPTPGPDGNRECKMLDNTPMIWCLADWAQPNMCDFLQEPTCYSDSEAGVRGRMDVEDTRPVCAASSHRPTQAPFTRLSIPTIKHHPISGNDGRYGNGAMSAAQTLPALFLVLTSTFFLLQSAVIAAF